MMDIALALGGETHADAMLELVVKRARALVSANAMAVGLNEGADVVVAAVAGALSEERRGDRIAIQTPAIGEAIRTRRPVRLDGDGVRALLHDHDTTPGARAGLVVPLVFRDRALGMLLAIDRLVDGPAFTERDEELLQAFSTTAAAALATAHSAAAESAQLRLAAEEAERNRWARELHDETLQALAMLRMTLSAARRKGDAEALGSAVTDALEHIDSEIKSLRGLIAELRPTALDDLGLGGRARGVRRAGGAPRRDDRARRRSGLRGRALGPALRAGARGDAVPDRPGGDHQRDQALGRDDRPRRRPRTSATTSSCASRTTGAGSTPDAIDERVRPARHARARGAARRDLRGDVGTRRRHGGRASGSARCAGRRRRGPASRRRSPPLSRGRAARARGRSARARLASGAAASSRRGAGAPRSCER